MRERGRISADLRSRYAATDRLGSEARVTITLQISSHVIPTMHGQAADLVAGMIGSAADTNVIPLRKAADSR